MGKIGVTVRTAAATAGAGLGLFGVVGLAWLSADADPWTPASAWVAVGTTMLGLGVGACLLVGRGRVGALRRLADLAARSAGAGEFAAAAAARSGEARRLGDAMAGLVRRIDALDTELRRQRDRNERLERFAPAAMLTVHPSGRIREANRAAAALFDLDRADALVGAALFEQVHPKDRQRLRAAFDAAATHDVEPIEVQMSMGGAARRIAIRLAASRRGSDRPTWIDLSLSDVTASRHLVQQLREQRRLLDLVIDHMADAILLLGPDSRIITANQRLGRLVGQRVDRLVGQRCDPAGLWAAVDLREPTRFEQRMARALDRPDRPATEQFETHGGGALRFLAIPVTEPGGALLAQLWVVQDVTTEARHRRLLEQQDRQLQGLRRLGEELREAADLDGMLDRVARQLRELLGVEAAGLAIRETDPRQRTRQRIDSGRPVSTLEAGRALTAATQCHLMPLVAEQGNTGLWVELGPHDGWSEPFRAFGVATLAATPLSAHGRWAGLIWIGRPAGRHLERHQIFLLEAFAPMLANALRHARWEQQMQALTLIDPATGWLTRRLFEPLAEQLRRRCSRWALIVLEVRLGGAPTGAEASAGEAIPGPALRRIAEALTAQCRLADQVIAAGGGRFILLCPDVEPAEIEPLCERVRRLPAALLREQSIGPLTIHVAHAGAPGDGVDPSRLLAIAEHRLHAVPPDCPSDPTAAAAAAPRA